MMVSIPVNIHHNRTMTIFQVHPLLTSHFDVQGLNIWRAGTIINISTISHIASFNENHSYVVSI
ncbi:hypothetical protein JHK84_053240 [Glycine max]|nr:hypothetical protein JHK84_053240 [Glycine max]